MSLDLFNPVPALQNAQANLAGDLPAGFAEAFDVSTRAMTEWNSSVNYQNARERALATYYDDIKAQTGVQLPLYGMGGAVSLDELNDGIAKLPKPLEGAGQSWRPLSESDVDAMALSRMRKAHEDAAAFGRRETTWGGALGTITGTLAAGVSDPVAIATLPLGGAGQAGIAARALEFALIGGGTEAAIAGAGANSREAAVPGSLREIPGEIASAALFGGVFGAGIGALQKLAGTGAKTLPVTVRDEVHAATSEAQLNLTNPFPTAAGEAAARDATIEATRSSLRGEPVKVGDDFAPRHVVDYALAAEAKTPDELAIAGEKHLRPETYGLEPEVERFDRVPSEADDVASYWDKRLEGASVEERAALGATDGRPPPPKNFQDIDFHHQPTPPELSSEPGVVSATGDFHEAGPYQVGIKTVTVGDRVVTKADIYVSSDAVEIQKIVTLDDVQRRGYATQLVRDLFEEFPDKRITTSMRTNQGRELFKQFGGEGLDLGRPKHIDVAARDLSTTEISALEADPKTAANSIHDLDHYVAANPEADFSTQVRMPDGSYQFTTQKLSDVVKELDEFERAAKELEACVIGLEAAE